MIFATTLISSSLGTVHGLTGGGTAPGAYSGDFAYEILYHRMTISVSGLQFSYDYGYGSGILRPTTAGQTIDDVHNLDGYISDLQSGVYDGTLPSLYNAHNAAPDIDVKKPCYIVLDIRGPQALSFQPTEYGVLIDPAKAAKYSCLYEYNTSLTRYAGKAPPAASNADLCYIAIFGIKTPSYDNALDTYSLSFQIAQSSGSPINAQIDPHIKNRG